MKKIPIYLCMCYRGKSGDLARPDEIAANIQKAKDVAKQIESTFGDMVHVYVPHTCSDLQKFNEDWAKGNITTGDIMIQCIKMVNEIAKKGGMLIGGGYISGGMKAEMDFAEMIGMKYYHAYRPEDMIILTRVVLEKDYDLQV